MMWIIIQSKMNCCNCDYYMNLMAYNFINDSGGKKLLNEIFYAINLYFHLVNFAMESNGEDSNRVWT